MKKHKIKVGLLGLGTVGGGTAQLLLEKKEHFEELLGAELELTLAADLDASQKERLGLDDRIFTQDASRIVGNPEIDIVVETIGGMKVAKDFMLEALSAGQQVVTANKALLATHGREIHATAKANQTSVAFEAAVGGGIPLIRSIREGLLANRIESCMGILNGTSNFILTRMTQDNAPFEEVLALAQKKGYAEQDPTFDVEGVDAAHKLAIITSLVTGDYPSLEDIHMEGISKITPLDIQFANEFGFTVKLLAIMKNKGQKVQARVHPALVPHDHVLASVDGAFNALHITGDWVGDVLLYGLGAGREATASAVVADVVDLARDLLVKSRGRVPALGLAKSRGEHLELAPMEETSCQYYFRFTAADEPGVLAKVSRILSEHNISIETVIQKGRRSEGSVPIVMMTHEAVEKDVSAALARINALPQITEPIMLMRKA